MKNLLKDRLNRYKVGARFRDLFLVSKINDNGVTYVLRLFDLISSLLYILGVILN